MKQFDPNVYSCNRIWNERQHVRLAYACGCDAACEDLPRTANPFRWRQGVLAVAQAEAWDRGWCDTRIQ